MWDVLLFFQMETAAVWQVFTFFSGKSVLSVRFPLPEAALPSFLGWDECQVLHLHHAEHETAPEKKVI